MKNSTLYLVTGVAGNLGSSVAGKLLEDGKSVRGLVLKGDPAATRIPDDVDIYIGDVCDKDSIERFFQAPQDTSLVVFHCAAIVTVNPDYNQKVYDVNVTGTKNIIDACVTHHAKKLVYVSSIGAIPELPHGKPITEIDSFDPNQVVGFYGKTKAEASQAVLDAVRNRGLDASLVFPSGICGPDDYAFGPVSSFLIDYCEGKLPGGVEGSFNAVDVRDLADAIVSCAERGRSGEGYILANECVSMQKMFHLLANLTNTKEITMILPAGLAKFVAKISDISAKITHKKPLMTSFAVYNLVRNNVFDCSKAENELGFQTRPFQESLEDSLAWLKRENKLNLANCVA